LTVGTNHQESSAFIDAAVVGLPEFVAEEVAVGYAGVRAGPLDVEVDAVPGMGHAYTVFVYDLDRDIGQVQTIGGDGQAVGVQDNALGGRCKNVAAMISLWFSLS
jgi:hypothetical protein